MYNQRVNTLQDLMKKNKIDFLIIPTNDYHNSEYIPEYFKSRVFITGFTGSAGTFVVAQDSAYLWTDGRYFIQAAKQLAGSGVTLMKMGQEGVPTISKFLQENLKENQVLGFDGRLINVNNTENYLKIAKNNGANVKTNIDFIDQIWTDRPELPQDEIFELDDSVTGENRSSKIMKIRLSMQKNGCDYYVCNDLTCICHLLNIRGNDIKCNPVVLSYLVISKDEVFLFVNKAKIKNELELVELRDYDEVYDFFKGITDKKIQIDPDAMNYTLFDCMNHNEIIRVKDPTYLMKAVRNEVQLDNIRKAHVSDAVAMIQFMYGLKKNFYVNLNEVIVDVLLTGLRKEQGAFENSFDTIAGFQENAALMHYKAKLEDCKKIKGNGLLLIDSGGQYMTGTTDTTRTYAIGEISDDERYHYTLVLKSLIALSKQKFLYGCTGQNLDILARQYLWNIGIDYQCGTGHGVGHILGVHEGPQGFRWKFAAQPAILEQGMTITIEPGVYIPDKYGIRLENEIIVQKDIQNEYGQFMKLETMTYTPFDLDAIDYSLLNSEEKEWLINFNSSCYNATKDYLDKPVKEWLKKYLNI